ncbi:MAG: biotin-dependent carboxyltransferase family protein [Betaproteobacteria bacterium]
MSVEVLRPGVLMTVQDPGRHGLQHIGVCPGGAMDGAALALANALVGNALDEAALEITLLGPDLQLRDETLVALGGGEFDANIPLNRPVLLAAGARLSVTRSRRGARAYLAVAGGIALEPVLGSRSTYLPGRFGGLEGRMLKRGDVLPLHPECTRVSSERYSALKHKRAHLGLNSVRWFAPPLTLPDREPVLIHAMDGANFADFDPVVQRAFFDAVWQIGPDSNRMGFRLLGPPLPRAATNEVLSGPTCLGTVQVPAGGVPIVLMADHQTTGGYPKIAEIASADVPRLAQLAPGGTVHFARCSLETAAELRHDAQGRMDAVLRGIRWEYGK